MASAVIGALRVNLGIDTAEFTSGLKGVQASMNRIGKQMQNWGATLTAGITAPLTLAGGAVAAAAAGMAKDIDELRKSAQISNVGFEEFQKLAYAAKSVGIEGDKLSDIFKDVNDKVGDFMSTGGGEMADFFKNIAPKVGITADAFKDLSGPEALQLYYDSLKKAGVSQAQMTFYMEAIADEATALIPLLDQGGEGFRKLGEGAAVIKEDQAAGLKAYNDAMRALGEAVKALTIAIATSGILEFVTQLIQGATSMIQTLSQTNPQILQWGVVIGGVAAAIGPVIAALGLFLTAVSVISAPVLATVAAIAATTAGIVALYQGLQIAIPYLQQMAGEVWAQIKAGAESASQAFVAFKDRVAQLATDIVNAFAALPGKMVEIGGQIIDGLWNGIKSKWESVKAGVAGIGTSISDSVKSVLGIHSPSRVMYEVGTNIMQGLQNGMQSLQGNVTSTAATTAAGVETAFSSLQDLGQSLSSSIGDVFAGFIEGGDAAKESLKGLVKQFASFALNDGLKALQNVFGGGSSSTGGSSGGGLGSIFGSVVKSLFGFSQGGSILPGGASTVTGVDSQVVAFRKKPSEQVDIYDPKNRRVTGSSVRGGDIIVQGDASENTLRLIRQAMKDNNRQIAYAQSNEWRR